MAQRIVRLCDLCDSIEASDYAVTLFQINNKEIDLCHVCVADKPLSVVMEAASPIASKGVATEKRKYKVQDKVACPECDAMIGRSGMGTHRRKHGNAAPLTPAPVAFTDSLNV